MHLLSSYSLPLHLQQLRGPEHSLPLPATYISKYVATHFECVPSIS